MKRAPGRDWARLGPAASAVRESAERLAREEFVDRVWRRDPFLWKSDEKHREIIENALGWLDAPSEMLRRATELEEWAIHARRGRRFVVLCGMGGSSLAPEVFGRVLGRPDAPELIVLDSTSPEQVRDASERIDLDATLFLISSKSGGTLETISQFRYFHDQALRRSGPPERAGEQFVAITDSGSPLEKLAIEHRFAEVFENLPGIGGRYSALSYFGLVPAALCGVDLPRLLERADEAAQACRTPGLRNPGLSLGAALGRLARDGRDKATIVCSAAIAPFGAWLEQLVAESTGKEGTGVVPIDGEPTGWPEDYSSDRFFLYERLDGAEGAGEADEKLDRLAQEGHPVRVRAWRDRYDLGARMFVWEFAVAAAGAVLGIDPFDQPNVQESKDNTNAVLAGFGKTKSLPRERGRRAAGGVSLHGETLERLLGEARPGRDYLALQAYVDRSPRNEETLLRLRRDLRNRIRCATTVGFGPRFLHSTGQLHKGGPKEGVFLQFVDPGEGDVPIPGSDFGFATFLEAQAIGDEKALRSRGLPFSGASASGPSADALSAWADRVRSALEGRK
ncbi:MAG TPA: glucose-6-phosphate isomerase [Thermoanaerobaculia bacterium]|nr:glucose-6-phosphate isomerase [Thermoanaerobaculia bacterium]